MPVLREAPKQGQSVRVDGRWGTFNYMVGQEWAVVTLDDGQQKLAPVRELRTNKAEEA